MTVDWEMTDTIGWSTQLQSAPMGMRRLGFNRPPTRLVFKSRPRWAHWPTR